MRRAVRVASSVLVFLLLSSAAWASETDLLLRKLVQKGVLTEQDAQELREEMAREKSGEAAVQPVSPRATAGAGEQSLPDWARTMKWSGDLMLRHETQRREPATDRNRERVRLRFGFTSKPWDPLELGVRLTTGASGDPVSTNQSFGSTFDRKAILLDRAYARYTPWEWMAIAGGKMENPFHTVSQIVWDADVTPEGGALQLNFPSSAPVKPFLNLGAFQISELSGDAGDPALFGVQGGAEVTLPLGLSWKPSAAYYDFTAIQGTTTANVTNSPAGNTTVAEGTATKFRDDFNLVALASHLKLPEIAGQPVALVADWTHNDGAEDDDGAWTAGLEVGKVTEKLGSWKAAYAYKRVEPDAAFGAITDSDFGGGGTNHQGHRMGVQVGLNKWASLALTYIRTDEIEGSQNKVDTLQADANVKF